MLSAATLWELVDRRVALTPGVTMLVDAVSGRKLSFEGVRDQALDYARWLQGEGVGPGSVVVWQMPTRIEAILLCLALSRLGVVQAPVIHLYRERELREVVRQSRPHFVLTPPAEDGQDYPGRVAAALAGNIAQKPRALVLESGRTMDGGGLPDVPRDGGAVRWHYYTSGTTSRPKGARHTDASLMAAGRGMAGVTRMGSEDVGSICFPFGHIGGILYVTGALAAGYSVVLFERFIPDEAVTAFRRFGVTYSGGSTPHYQALLAEQRRHPESPIAPTLKVLYGGGASKPAALFHQVKQEIGCTVVHAYGMTECPICVSNAPDDTDEQLANSDGVPLNDLEIRIRQADGTPAPAGVSGEIVLRGANLFEGYLDAEQTRVAFDEDGFFRTGDLGVMRLDGRLCVTGRIKDIIIRKGENVSALEIEELLLEHPKVQEAAVIGLPDEERGEMVCAVVVPRDAAEPLGFAEMQQFLAGRQLMKQKIPERLEIRPGLPRNEGLQKVLKSELREQIMGTSTGTGSS